MQTPRIKWIPMNLFTVLSTVYLGVRKHKECYGVYDNPTHVL